MIPTKLEIPKHTEVLRRCIDSIRRFHPQVLIIIARAANSLPVPVIYDEHTQIVENPFFSTWGCLYLFHTHHYAQQAYVIHDSVVLTRPVQPVDRVQFVYHFNEPGLDRPRNDEGYSRLLPPGELQQMLETTRVGCFGNMIILDHDLVAGLGFLDYIPRIKTKYDFECMERIASYLVSKHGYKITSLCGDIFSSIADPWVHSEYALLTLDQVDALNFPAVFLKAIIARK